MKTLQELYDHILNLQGGDNPICSIYRSDTLADDPFMEAYSFFSEDTTKKQLRIFSMRVIWGFPVRDTDRFNQIDDVLFPEPQILFRDLSDVYDTSHMPDDWETVETSLKDAIRILSKRTPEPKKVVTTGRDLINPIQSDFMGTSETSPRTLREVMEASFKKVPIKE